VICFPDKITELADQLESIRMEVLSTVAAAEPQEQRNSRKTCSRGRKLSALDWKKN